MEATLIQAIERNDPEGTRRVLEKGASPDFCFPDNVPGLIRCALLGRTELVEILLRFGADVNVKDIHGKTALDYAATRSHQAVTELLTRFGGRSGRLQFTTEEEAFLRDAWGSELYEQVRSRMANTPEVSLNSPVKKEAPSSTKPVEEIRLEELVGQASAKAALMQVIALTKVNRERKERNLPVHKVNLHAVFAGSPGTGKTTFARYYAQEVQKVGVLSSGHLLEVSRQELVGEYMGQTASKTTAVVEKAKGGILFIDEAYSLKQSKEDAYGQECINTLIKLVEDLRDELILILAGYTDEMREFLQHNPGLQSRVPNFIFFEDFTDSELEAILEQMCRKGGVSLSPEDSNFALEEILRKQKGRYFGNAREVRNLFERALAQQSARLSRKDLKTVTSDDLNTLIRTDLTESPYDDEGKIKASVIPTSPTEQLMVMQGLDDVKRELKNLSDFIRLRRARKEKGTPLDSSLHMAFMGNSGTGKTSVARLLGSILRETGALPSGHTVTVDRSQLVGGYLGQTAIQVRDRVHQSLGGVLYIADFPSLARGQSGDSYGQEAIDTIISLMDQYRNQFALVAAGSQNEMELLFDVQPALKGRFGRILMFPDLTTDQMLSIADGFMKEQGYRLSSEGREKLKTILNRERSTTSFSNARTVRSLVDSAYWRQASRVMKLGDPKSLQNEVIATLEAADFPE